MFSRIVATALKRPFSPVRSRWPFRPVRIRRAYTARVCVQALALTLTLMYVTQHSHTHTHLFVCDIQIE
jgi:hypothetical protein